jgi:hexosaminidase
LRVASHGQIRFLLDPRAGSANPESYDIRVSAKGIVVSARDKRGLFYGAVTLWQLLTADSSRSDVIQVPLVHIVDEPRFAWRGLLLDSARSFRSPEFIERYIDAMALHKLNVLHWHLTDDQGWRLEIKKYPKLTEVGAWRVPAGPAAAADIDPSTGKPRVYGGFYSQDTVRKLVAYAAARNITIVPEIEMPGHASAAIAAYPQLGVFSDKPLKGTPADWGVYPNLYNVEESTFGFLEDVMTEVLALFPSTYIHVGGDEAVKDQWKASPRVQARMRELGVENEARLQGYFIRRMEKFLDAHGRRLIGWDEILEGGLGPKSTVMSWRGVDGALAAAQAGHDAVLSPGPTLYLDNRQSPLASEPPGRGRVITTQMVYQFDPMPAALSADQQRHILGVQGNVWSEHIRTDQRVLYMTFPRAAAVAEVGWSAHDQIDWGSFAQRLSPQLARYDALGIQHAAVTAPPVQLSAFKRKSQELKMCTENLVLALEDDAPLRGDRAVFLVDIMNPCWIFEGADLSQATSLTASVGNLPFNFQIGDAVNKIPLVKPATPDGELEVRLDNCQGERIAVLPLAPAAERNDVTTLPPVTLKPREGRHDLCFMFTRSAVDPLWAIETIDVEPRS